MVSRGETEDLATLPNLEENSLLQELKARYKKAEIYTYIGDILVAINPYRDLNLYTKQICDQYKGRRRTDLPPHIFAVADSSYQSLVTGKAVSGKINQCVVISGESGAGKTESTKLIIKQLIELCRGKTQLEQQILQVNPILEAFGNAQTVMNDNSSRFGKYIQLKFHEAKVTGAKISEYLLEKSRVIFQNPKEENFHIFYYMFAGLEDGRRKELQLEPPEKYRYLGNGPCRIRKDPAGTQKAYEKLVDALNLVGFLEEEEDDMFRILAGVLNMGQIEVDTNENEEAFIRDADMLTRVANILGLEEHQLKNMLTFSTSRASGEFFTRNYTKEQAHSVRDALAKALYGRLFSWIVNKVNQLLAPEELPSAGMTEIGILDIFGFENLGMNSFEQVCINLANEQLQHFFNQHIFTLEQAEYQMEGVDWTRVPFVNNHTLLELFMAKPISVMALLDEESLFPKGSDHSYVEKLNHNFTKNHHYIRAKVTTSNKFIIDHYAGRVEYDATGFLEKNKDALPLGATQLFKTSTIELISIIFTGTITRTGTLALQYNISGKKKSRKSIKKGRVRANQSKKLTVGAQFKNSLQVLIELLNGANPHFVRCIKPNTTKESSRFDDKFVMAQLRYTGMVETTRIRKMGYAFRPSFAEFVKRYGVLTCNPNLSANQHACRVILERAGITDGWIAGKTKVFLKYYHQDKLEEEMKAFALKAIQGQKFIRGFLARRAFAKALAKYHKEQEDCNAFMLNLGRLSLDLHQKLLNLYQTDEQLPDKFLKLLASAGGEVVTYDINNPPLTPPPSPPPTPSPPPEQSPPTLPERTSITEPPDTSPSPTAVRQPTPLLLMGKEGEDIEESNGEGELEGEPEAGEEQEDEDHESDSGEEEDEEDEVEIEEDVFVKKKTLRRTFGGKKGAASKRWFQETQYNGLKESLPFLNWFHGIITRRQAEKLLEEKPEGAFLIRVSESRFGYSVSLKAQERCKHFAVDQLRNKRYVVVGEERTFRTLMDMVRYYRSNPISPYGDKLKEAVGQEEDECDYDDLLKGLPEPKDTSVVQNEANNDQEGAVGQTEQRVSHNRLTINKGQNRRTALKPKSKKESQPKRKSLLQLRL